MLHFLEASSNNLLAVEISGKLDQRDYDKMLPLLEEKIQQYGKVNVYIEILEFPDFTLEALWQELKFDVKHATDFKKVALVGEGKLLEAMRVAATPFTSAEIKVYSPAQRQEAMNWVKEVG